jgi:hypothetical protein
MEFDAAKLDVPICQEKLDDYWRERAECLEEWVCELLRKNQILRMALQKEQPLQQYREETTPALSSLRICQSLFPSDRPGFSTEFPNRPFDTGTESCPRQECVEIRDSVIQTAVINEFENGGAQVLD